MADCGNRVAENAVSWVVQAYFPIVSMMSRPYRDDLTCRLPVHVGGVLMLAQRPRKRVAAPEPWTVVRHDQTDRRADPVAI